MSTVICTYQVKGECEDEFRAILSRHYSCLRAAGLVTKTTPQYFRRVDDEGRPTFVEIFEWVSPEAARAAHSTPEVLAEWEAMSKLCVPRAGRPAMEFPHFQRTDLNA
jgi:hypothetical protein